MVRPPNWPQLCCGRETAHTGAGFFSYIIPSDFLFCGLFLIFLDTRGIDWQIETPPSVLFGAAPFRKFPPLQDHA